MELQWCLLLSKKDITILGYKAPTQVVFKNFAPFTKCITKIDGTTVDEREDWDLVTPICNLLECSLNYPDTTGNLWFYSKDEEANFNADIMDNNFKSFKYQAKLLGNTEGNRENRNLRNTTVKCCVIKITK